MPTGRKVLLIMPPNDSDMFSSLKPDWSICRIPPIGLLSIASYLTGKGRRTTIIDCRQLITEYPDKPYIYVLIEMIRHLRPDVVGINMLTANYNHVDWIASAIKGFMPKVRIIAGGVHPSVEPELTLEDVIGLDAVCIGAGEEVMLEVAEGNKLQHISGLKLRDEEYIYIPRNQEVDIDRYPYPDYSLLNQEWYTQLSTYTITGWGYRGVSALTSRSCPYSCKFCSADWSKPFRYHSAEYVIGLVKHLSKLPIDVISFFDDTIAINEKRLNDICDGFIREKLFYPNTHLRWIGELRANQVKPELLKLMKDAGCFHIGMGLESGSDRMLKEINKKITVDESRQACCYIKEAGMSLGVSFMMGIPNETEEDMRATIALMKEIDCNYMGIGTFRPLPGSPYYDELIKDKENIDWTNLGNFMLPTIDKYYYAPKRTFFKLFDEAYNFAYARQWVSFHYDTFLRDINEISQIAKQIRCKITVPALEGNYFSDYHTYLRFSKRLTWLERFEKIYMRLPYEIRRPIKNIVRSIARQRMFRKQLWRYS